MKTVLQHQAMFNAKLALFPIFIAFILLVCSAGPSEAHKPSDSYVRLAVEDQEITGEWAVALRDLELAVGVDMNGDSKITWGEILDRREVIEAHLDHALSLSNSSGPKGLSVICPIVFNDIIIDEYSDGHYVLFRFKANCGQKVDVLHISYQFLFDLDNQHKGLVALHADGYDQSAILSADLRQTVLEAHAPSLWRQLREYTRQGMLHIWFGLDHLFFLLALLLPAAIIYKNGRREKDVAFKTVFLSVFTYISAFTLAHALTLGLAMFDLFTLRTRFVESLIALTIVFSCVNNLRPVLKERLYLLTFGFGLIHGMGFATTLSELGLAHSARWIALLGFNFGVELGQLAIVALLLPIFYTIRNHKFYDIVIVRGMSVAIFLVAAIWFVQRAFAIVLIRSFIY